MGREMKHYLVTCTSRHFLRYRVPAESPEEAVQKANDETDDFEGGIGEFVAHPHSVVEDKKV